MPQNHKTGLCFTEWPFKNHTGSRIFLFIAVNPILWVATSKFEQACVCWRRVLRYVLLRYVLLSNRTFGENILPGYSCYLNFIVSCNSYLKYIPLKLRYLNEFRIQDLQCARYYLSHSLAIPKTFVDAKCQYLSSLRTLHIQVVIHGLPYVELAAFNPGGNKFLIILL